MALALGDVGDACNGLLVNSQILVLLVGQVADGPRQGQLACHAAVRDVAPCRLNSDALVLVIGLVIVGQVKSARSATQDGPRVACISTVDLSLGDKQHARRRSHVHRNFP